MSMTRNATGATLDHGTKATLTCADETALTCRYAMTL
jgi:hypothetical protein